MSVDLAQKFGGESFARLAQIIQSGQCVLFLGAGVSIESGAPSGQMLADELGNEFLNSQPGSYRLDEVGELVDANEGRKAVNEWLMRRLGALQPAGSLMAIPLFRWKSIYTVNFDTLLEDGYAKQPDRAQRVRPFYSDKDSLSLLESNEVALYKLHGCLSRANTVEGHLVVTQEDELRVTDSRMRLFNRLLDDVSDFTVLYVGFRRHDPDFTKVIISVRQSAGELLGPRRSYALQPGYTPPEERRWEQSRVQLLDVDAADFFKVLVASLGPGERFVQQSQGTPAQPRPLLELKPQLTNDVLVHVERNFEVIDEGIRVQPANTSEFFLGAPPNWGSVAASVDAVRDAADDVMGAVLVDPLLDRRGPQFALIHAEAGTGKSTLVRRLGVDLALTWKQVVIALKPYGSLDFSDVEPLARQLGERFYILIDDASDMARELSQFLTEARSVQAKVTVIAGARTNEWREVQADYVFPGTKEYELGPLSRGEIERIIDALSRHDSLGLLSGASKEAQIEAFESRADKQLLVALREATEGKKFDDIVVDEYDSIPSPDGQRAYLLVSSLHRFGIFVRAALLYRALNIPLAELGQRVFGPTTKVIVAREALNDAEHYYSARHQLIADIVFDRKVGSERRRLEYYADLVRHLDIGYGSDADAFRKLTRGKNKQLLRDFARVENRRELMEQLLRIDPSDAFAFQHAAMMELDSGDLEAASKYLSRALELRPGDPAVRDTEGLLLLKSAMREGNEVVASARFARAEDVFARNIQRRRQEPFGYRHLAETYLSWGRIHKADDKRLAYTTLAYRTLLDGISRCSATAMLYQYLGEIEDSLGEPENARKAFSSALRVKPGDLVTRFVAARLEERTQNPDAALGLLVEGLNTSAQEPELHYRIAVLMAGRQRDRVAEIKAHFEAAMLGPLRNYMPRLAYCAYLFSRRDYKSADDEFSRLEELLVPSSERFAPHYFAFGDLADRQTGRIIRRTYSYAIVEFDQGATTAFMPLRELAPEVASTLSHGQTVTFKLAFNLKGPLALEPELTVGRGAVAAGSSVG